MYEHRLQLRRHAGQGCSHSFSSFGSKLHLLDLAHSLVRQDRLVVRDGKASTRSGLSRRIKKMRYVLARILGCLGVAMGRNWSQDSKVALVSPGRSLLVSPWAPCEAPQGGLGSSPLGCTVRWADGLSLTLIPARPPWPIGSGSRRPFPIPDARTLAQCGLGQAGGFFLSLRKGGAQPALEAAPGDRGAGVRDPRRCPWSLRGAHHTVIHFG